VSQPAIGKRPNRSISVPGDGGIVWVSDHRPSGGVTLRRGRARIDLTRPEVLAVFDAVSDLLRSPYPFQPTRKTDR
jgi:hypothetical protein